MVQLPEEGPGLTPAVQIFTQLTRVCFNTRSEWRVCARVRLLCVCECVHTSVSWSRWLLRTRLRLRALNGASGRFPFTPLQAPPPPGRPPLGFERSGAQNPTRYAAALPRSMSHRGKRPQLPLVGGSVLGLGCGRLLPSPRGKGKEASLGRPGPGFAASLTSSSLEPLHPSPRAPRSPAGASSLTKRCSSGPWSRLPGWVPQADPARAKDLCHDFGQVILRVASLRGDQNSEGRA